MKVAALEGGLKKLQEIINDNARRTGHGLFVGDNHMWVHGAMIADLASGQLKINDNGEADFPYYYGKRQEFLQRMVAEQEAKNEPVEQKPDEPEEFGGDYGSSEERSEEPAGQQGEGAAEDVGDGEPEAAAVPEVPQPGVAQQEQPG